MKWKIIHFDQLESTNITAREFPINTAIIADTQSGGHGRYGRHWESPKGNLYLSIVLPEYGFQTPLLSFLVGVAVAQALSNFDVRLKWPNDILKQGKKLAGILLERTEDDRIIVGIGVNVASHPIQNMLYETASLEGKLSVKEVCERILNSLEKLLLLFEQKGFEPIRKLWLEKAEGVGKEVKVNLSDRQLIGIFSQLSPEGALVLELPDRTVQKITAGDVFLI